jgi:hypothetical protein
MFKVFCFSKVVAEYRLMDSKRNEGVKNLKIEVFWDVTPCRLVNGYRHFEALDYLTLILKALDP